MGLGCLCLRKAKVRLRRPGRIPEAGSLPACPLDAVVTQGPGPLNLPFCLPTQLPAPRLPTLPCGRPPHRPLWAPLLCIWVFHAFLD